MNKKIGLLAMAAVTALAVACTSPEESTPTPASTPVPTATPMAEVTEPTIVDIAVEDGRFTTLVAALSAAGLVETLSGDGPFTVFAPTDSAFGALPSGTVEGLLGDIPALTDVLTYHVVLGEVLAADVVTLNSAITLQGSEVAVRVENGNVFIDDAQVVITDIVGTNGVIHVIDAVLLPPADDEWSGGR